MGVYIAYTRLPSAYQEVEYIESTGTQFLAIGNSFSTDYKVEIDVQLTATGGDQLLFGCTTGVGESSVRFGVNAYSSNFKTITGGSSWSNTKSEDANRHTFIMDKGITYVDGTSYSSSYISYTYNFGLGLFVYNRIDGGERFPAKEKLFSCKIYNGSTILYDLVPCYRKSDNVIGMYDIVNNQFYTNSGTGTFIKGADVTAVPLKNAYIGEVWTPTSNTIAYYPLTAETTTNDKSGNGYNLTNANVTFGTNGGVSCASFNGTSSRLYGGSNFTTGQPYTLSIWAYYISNNGTEDPIYYGGIGIWIDSSRRIMGTNTLITSGEWTYLTLTYDGNGNMGCFKNGVSFYTRTGASPSTGATYIGCFGGTKDRWKGYLSEALIENKARTAQEIADYFDITKTNYGL